MRGGEAMGGNPFARNVQIMLEVVTSPSVWTPGPNG